MRVEENLSFSSQILDWYWEFGSQRKGKYALPKGAWVDRLYLAQKQLKTLQPALETSRPSIAIWGPSQTGKSTLASKYIDSRARFVGDLALDGTQSGLHWEGGAPSFFLKPEEDPDQGVVLREGTLVLNPFNSGLDASACLSRFVLGSRTPADNRHLVHDPKYPVGLKWVKPIELWQSIARGYDSQCLGPTPVVQEGSDGRPPPRFPRTWTHDKLIEVFRRHCADPIPKNATPSREAYEVLHDFCDLLEDLIFAELPRFRQLDSGESSWHAIRHEILSETGEGPSRRNSLHYSKDLAYKFTSEVLWDGYVVLSNLHQEMLRTQTALQESWRGKPVYCSLEVASLILDMETYLVFLRPLPARPRPKDLRIHRRVPEIAWEDRGDYIVIGTEPGLAHKLIRSPHQIATLQGLVWEMLIPLNPDNLDDTPFKRFLDQGDLLDFPGVERGGQSADKIDLDKLSRRIGPMADRDGEESSERDEPYQLFLRVLKRGKTSSIVCTYAQRASIDGFSIFQDLDRDKPNGAQLVEGINSWWKHSAPDYYHNQQGPSPLPLNFVLLWWASFFNEGQHLSDLSKKFTGLGPIVDSEISTTFALNYYSLARGIIHKERENAIPEMVDALKADPTFHRYFAKAESKESFDAMISDKKTGGTDFFFSKLEHQVREMSEADVSARKRLLIRKAEQVIVDLHALMQLHEIFPDPLPSQFRRETLQSFRKCVEKSTAKASERKMMRINHALRNLLDIDSGDLVAVPRSPIDITIDHLRGQLQQWINSKTTAISAATLDAAILGLEDRETVAKILAAMAESIDPDLESVAVWLARLVQYAQGNVGDAIDLRRPLALRLCNMLVYGKEGPIIRTNGSDALDPLDPRERLLKPDPIGSQCRYYLDFIEPFIGPDGHLDRLAQRQVSPVLRPDQPGDREIQQITRSTHGQITGNDRKA